MALAMLLGVGLGTVACSAKEPEEAEPDLCERVRDHLIELRLAEAVQVDREAHRVVLRRALGPDFSERCLRSISYEQGICILRALDGNAAAECSAPKS